MSNDKTLTHKGYHGNIDFSLVDGVLHGQIQCINDLVTYEAKTLQELQSAFIEAVDDYLETCEEIGKSPDKPMTGSLNVRIGSELHKKLHIRSLQESKSINEIIKTAIGSYFVENKELHMHVHVSKPEQRKASFAYQINEPVNDLVAFKTKGNSFEVNTTKRPEVKH